MKLTATIKKFWYEIWEGYTVIISLSEKLKSLQQRYKITLKPAHEDEQLVKAEDTEFSKISFTGFVLRTLDFREIKFKVDGTTIPSLVDLKSREIEEVGISLEALEF